MKSDEEAACEALIRQLGGEVVRLSEPGRTVPWHAGLPDFRFRVRGVAMWCEAKSPTDKLTRAQLQFLKAEYACRQVIFAGGADAFRDFLLLRPSEWLEAGYEYVAIMAARGFRDEKASA